MFLYVSSQLFAVLGIHAGRFYNYGFSPLNAELNPICHLLALLGGANIIVVSRLRVNMISLRRKCPLWELPVLTRPVTTGSETSISLKHVSYFETSSNCNVLLLLLILLLLTSI